MTAHRSATKAYIRRLDRELRVRRAPRRRLLAEAEDHLRSTAEELVSAGRSEVDAEREAIARFGAAADVAHRFAHAKASAAARRAFACAGAVFLAYGATVMVFLAAAPGWLRDFPQGAPSTIALQVAAVALGLTAVRALACRPMFAFDEDRLRLVANGALTAALAVGAGATAELLVGLTRPSPAPWADATPLLATFGVVFALCIPATLTATASYARATGLGVLHGGRARADGRDELMLAADFQAIAPQLGNLARAGLRLPGRTCAAVAGAAFVAVFVVQLVGADSNRDASPILGALTAGLVEAVAVVVGFLTLGRALGLRRRRGH
jgi:vacuolar-type H+-ATPase subunit H